MSAPRDGSDRLYPTSLSVDNGFFYHIHSTEAVESGGCSLAPRSAAAVDRQAQRRWHR